MVRADGIDAQRLFDFLHCGHGFARGEHPGGDAGQWHALGLAQQARHASGPLGAELFDLGGAQEKARPVEGRFQLDALAEHIDRIVEVVVLHGGKAAIEQVPHTWLRRFQGDFRHTASSGPGRTGAVS